MESYNKSVVPYVADSLKKAEETISEAEAAYAEKLSPDNYAQAKEQYAAANEKFAGQNYPAALALSEEAYNSAVKAKEDSLDGKYQLKVKIDEVRSTLTKVKKYDYEPYARDKFNIASGKLRDAERSYGNESLKDGFDAIEIAKINADAAYAATIKGVSGKKLSEAEDETLTYPDVTYPDGSKYTGHVKNGKAHGEGTKTWRGIETRSGHGLIDDRSINYNAKYVGQWENDKKHGNGTLTLIYEDGDNQKYVGQFKDDKKHGQGKETFQYGDNYGEYIGQFKDDKKHGYGTSKLTMGSIVLQTVGQFTNGEASGDCTVTMWQDGICIGQCKLSELNEAAKRMTERLQ